MRPRKDGQATRENILKAACQVFGEKGYRGATHAEICQRAGVNIAAINYHFGSKDMLYRAAWERAIDEADAVYPLDGGVPADAPAEERFRGHIRALVRRGADHEKLGHFHSIRMLEIVNPTGLLDEAFAAWRRRARAFTREILGALLGPDAPARSLDLCEMSVISQCHMARPHHGPGREIWRFADRDMDQVADHICAFSLAGIQAVRPGRVSRDG
ncbi:MAG: CerR family C-terminal domain-containing protein [Candidatus Hydrogenedentes bacterium]|nr:CerR family C-terminal domain-containing protein [Candidatus Hydrogenedentota bacterium]